MPAFRIDINEQIFSRDLKASLRKHPTLSADLAEVFSSLETNPNSGDWIPGLGTEVRKIRIGVKKQGISPRKGYRLIYKVDRELSVVTPLLLHYKPEIELVSHKEILKVLKTISDRQAQGTTAAEATDSIQ